MNERKVILASSIWRTDPESVIHSIKQEIDTLLEEATTGCFVATLTLQGPMGSDEARELSGIEHPIDPDMERSILQEIELLKNR